MRWFDTHCHISDAAFMGASDREAGLGPDVITAARHAGVTRMVTVGTDAAHSASALAVAHAHEGVWATVGLHPHDAVQGVDTIVPLMSEPKVAAVGECGLDYHSDHSPRPVQREAFPAQIALAFEHGRTLVIHTREAWDDTFGILESTGVPERTVFHCFTGGPVEARRCLDLGAYLSFSGIVTFKSADDVRSAAALCPLDRLLVETDAPYLAPAPHRGKRNQPALVTVVGAAVATVRGLDTSEVAQATWSNAHHAFDLRPSAEAS